jgi:Periplasmic glucans biosynthesis protein
VEIPTPDETNDNIVAYWVPDASLKPGQPLDFAYQVAWEMNHPTNPPSSWVTQTRRGFDTDSDHHKDLGFVVDFHGPALEHLAKGHSVDGVVTTDANGKILSEHVVANDAQGGERLFIQMQRIDDSKPVELRAYLKDGNNTVSETWSYILPPK